jgi:hypothetical protein
MVVASLKKTTKTPSVETTTAESPNFPFINVTDVNGATGYKKSRIAKFLNSKRLKRLKRLR